MAKIVILESVHGSYIEEEAVLKSKHELKICHNHEKTEILKTCSDAHAILVNTHHIDQSIIDQTPYLKVISRYGVGYDNVDVDYAEKKGIWVAHCPEYCNEEVAEHALALLLGLTREIGLRAKHIRERTWGKQPDSSMKRLSQMNIGIVGFGQSGKALARKLSGLRPKSILVHDPSLVENELEPLITAVKFDQLLANCDAVSLHLPLNQKTKHLFNQNTFQKMKPGALLINTSRGSIVHENDLVHALSSGLVGGAGLDVFEQEPLLPNHPLLNLNNVIVTDHSAWYSPESFSTLKTITAKNALAVLEGGKPLFPVNKPTLKHE